MKTIKKLFTITVLVLSIGSTAQTNYIHGDNNLDGVVDAKDQVENICDKISVEKDEYTGEVIYNSPYDENFGIVKYIKKGKTNQYVFLYIYDSYFSGYSNYGLTILFKSGKKIIRPNEKVDVDSSSGANWRYSVFFTPNLNEIKLLKTDEIVGIKLYIFKKEIYKGEEFNKISNCILVEPFKK
jgi:hypothetical protein